MTYTVKNYRTKKELKFAVEKGDVPVQAEFITDMTKEGTAYIEGPHYPEPHKWYAQVTVKDGVIPKGSKVK